uniref:NADH dehydrogenase subunit 5 n=1 Tax=Haemadipsa hainana TaxID=909595 RepID=UPI0030E41921
MSYYSPNLLLVNSIIIFIFSAVMFNLNSFIYIDWEIFNMNMLKISFPVLIDYKGCLFSFIVLFISFNVMMFSVNYMEADKNNNLFTIVVLMFIMSMNLLIYIPHMGFLLLGWDGLGIISFVLVIYYLNNKSLSAGFITAFTNRIGDILLLMSIGLTLYMGNWIITDMWYKNMMEIKFQIIFILLASMTKSAQLPFSSWLPAAMAAPTPVSALVHSSTLVTAGVFLVLRFYQFLSKSYYFFMILMLISILTLFMAGFSASMEWDMKKIIALSTLSQLGLMMLMISMMSPHISFIHMVVHAMFKALLFICAGTLIMNYIHSQDLRWMGNISLKLPMSCIGMIVSIMAMCGMPFMSSFYTKDPMLEFSLFYMNFMNLILLSYLSIGITSYYSLRFLMLLIWSMNLSNPFMNFIEKKHSVASLILMSTVSITISIFLMWQFLMKDTIICLSINLSFLPMLIMLTGLMMSFIMNYINKKISYRIQIFNNKMWFIYPLMSQYNLNFFLNYSKLYLDNIDQSLLENYSGEGFIMKLKNLNYYYFYLNFSPVLLISFMLFFIMFYSLIF